MNVCSLLRAVLVGVALLAGLLPVASAQPQPARTFTNPLRDEGPDPWVTQHGGFYYYTNTTGKNITLWKTKALSEVRTAPATVVWTPPATGPNSTQLWAPELHFLDGKWYLYYTATDRANPGDQSRYVFVLENSSPDPTTGTWTDRGKVNTRYPGLDGSVFEQGGQRYFLYSAYVGPQSVLAIAPMQTPWALSAGQEVVIAQPTLAWEKGGGRQILEGPEFLRGQQGQLFVVYSASACWDDKYCLGMLTAQKGSDPLKPSSWIKAATPVFQFSAPQSVWGTGHNCFTKSPDGRQDWIVYHAKSAADGKCEDRSSRMQQFTWNSNGTPNFGTPVPLTQRLPKPSGE
ncbi:glycoside hydrolase family 43 protein [Hymenobacter volaticus]|uniref:Glycoside hydrolase family 43 protein n=1 Tax=Hymenobacter volaticus TaxID=2932254 RepID=A0ABY4GEE9_9BACT|nr:glycoside hydrolase family 43 protein [Hymenobacter volaticus]UOQ68914.1 glycoside hydrolase family 43 protein [Hymenobacter volaticus]